MLNVVVIEILRVIKSSCIAVKRDQEEHEGVSQMTRSLPEVLSMTLNVLSTLEYTLLDVREKNCSAEENRQSLMILYLVSSRFSRYPTGKGTNKGTVVWLTTLGWDWVQKACEHVRNSALNAVETETRS